MKHAIAFVLLLAACSGAPSGGALTGAENPRAAVQRFLAAARAQDMQAISVVWGNAKGPQREQIERAELEKREQIMIALLRHDQATISEPRNAPDNKVTVIVELKQGVRTAAPWFTVARGPSNRWYVEDLDLVTLQNKGFGSKP